MTFAKIWAECISIFVTRSKKTAKTTVSISAVRGETSKSNQPVKSANQLSRGRKKRRLKPRPKWFNGEEKSGPEKLLKPRSLTGGKPYLCKSRPFELAKWPDGTTKPASCAKWFKLAKEGNQEFERHKDYRGDGQIMPCLSQVLGIFALHLVIATV